MLMRVIELNTYPILVQDALGKATRTFDEILKTREAPKPVSRLSHTITPASVQAGHHRCNSNASWVIGHDEERCSCEQREETDVSQVMLANRLKTG